ncbi:Kinesin-like protein unc-104 [Chionoecetes opilio]|uniref:Kinesin-like protein unc-104 n=1 Tax=Chionoecetes opilio TaxID=41210 RepID=A0A8J4YG25_CHIOP|nr:Kinesin-like protein unc-104 [Chionoecetes opilio]
MVVVVVVVMVVVVVVVVVMVVVMVVVVVVVVFQEEEEVVVVVVMVVVFQEEEEEVVVVVVVVVVGVVVMVVVVVVFQEEEEVVVVVVVGVVVVVVVVFQEVVVVVVVVVVFQEEEVVVVVVVVVRKKSHFLDVRFSCREQDCLSASMRVHGSAVFSLYLPSSSGSHFIPFPRLSITGEEITKVMNSKNDKETPQITSPVSTVAENAVDQLHANEKLIAELNETWEDKLKRTESIRLQRVRGGILRCWGGLVQNQDGVVLFTPPPGPCYVNGREVLEPMVLKTGSRVILGKNHVFRFNHPEQFRERREAKSPAEAPGIGEPADWQFAQVELLENQGIDLKEEMQKRLVALEEQYLKEKEAVLKEFEKERKGWGWQAQLMLCVGVSVNPLFDAECNWSVRDYALASWSFRKWKYHQFTSLRDDLWGNAIFLKEANAISVELKKKVQFQFTLLTDTLYSPLPPDFLPLMDEEDEEEDEDERPIPRTIVAVEVQDTKNGATHHWTLEKLRHRLELMRQIYNSDTSPCSPLTPSPPLADHPREEELHTCIPACNQAKLSLSQLLPTRLLNSRIQRLELMREMYHNEAELSPTSPDYNIESLTGGDPFYDRFPWFRLLGRSVIGIMAPKRPGTFLIFFM